MKIRYDLFPTRQSLMHSPTFIDVYETSDESETARIWPRRYVQSLDSSGPSLPHKSHITPLSPTLPSIGGRSSPALPSSTLHPPLPPPPPPVLAERGEGGASAARRAASALLWGTFGTGDTAAAAADRGATGMALAAHVELEGLDVVLVPGRNRSEMNPETEWSARSCLRNPSLPPNSCVGPGVLLVAGRFRHEVPSALYRRHRREHLRLLPALQCQRLGRWCARRGRRHY